MVSRRSRPGLPSRQTAAYRVWAWGRWAKGMAMRFTTLAHRSCSWSGVALSQREAKARTSAVKAVSLWARASSSAAFTLRGCVLGSANGSHSRAAGSRRGT